ncbi:hypothetical protein WN48_07019 [Eufriesea mexicana]|uniref:Uncharacterized protein n=1 Tax=Eufriesea mexicana TaxID=516756 RepID=A0A310SSC3_9HYME|nr:hypothetical protein WN48_07019 [Eufriesea mexicana]
MLPGPYAIEDNRRRLPSCQPFVTRQTNVYGRNGEIDTRNSLFTTSVGIVTGSSGAELFTARDDLSGTNAEESSRTQDRGERGERTAGGTESEKGNTMLVYVSSIISTLLLEGERVVPGQEKYNMATFMVLFLLITIEVVVVKVVTSDMERDEESHAGVENAATSSGQGSTAEKEEANTMETVRDSVEKIVEGLIGNVANAPINRLYDHPAYDKLLEKHVSSLAEALSSLAMDHLRSSLENKSGTDSPTMAHMALRDIVERAVDEAKKLPGLGGSGGTGKAQEERNIAERSYEDFLANEILNKVIEKFQKKQVDGNSNVLPGKPVSAKCTLSESEAGLEEGVEEGCSSLEPLSQDDCSSDCSASCSRRVRNQPEPLSLTIEERIEEVTTTYASDEEPRENDVLAIKNTHRVPFPELGMDIIDPSQESEDSQEEPDTPHIDLVSPVESWEENWLFQKKRVQTQPDPVAMLVPNPSADYKALIGDKDAEDTSDLSECSSAQSDEELEKELMDAINNVVPRSPRKREFENGLDHHSEEYRGQSQSLEKNDEVKAKEVEEKEVERKWSRIESKDEKLVAEPIDLTSNYLKMEMERQTTNDISKEDKTRNLINEDDLIKPVSQSVEKSEFVMHNLSNSVNLEPSTVSLPYENMLDVPKTPTSTPTWSSVIENTEDIQQESEYTEHYDIATQRHLDSLTKTESSESWPLTNSSTEECESKCREAVAFAKAESASHVSLQNKNSEEEVRLATPPRPGTIAEREHKKWENAPPIENNPYSQENIQKRLLERQYSRRSSDIPGIHSELPKSNGADLDVVLAPHEPDIKRFGRDYYINESRIPGNEKGRRSAASTSSRPSSSLSQRSSSNGIADQDQQVSFQLEKFEEASLRGSLSRWTYRDQYSSPHFAINPLLHMELDATTESADNINENNNVHNENSLSIENDIRNDINYRENMTQNFNGNHDISIGINNNIEEMKNTSFPWNKPLNKVTYNPIFETENDIPNPDRDSGMFSVDTNDLETKKEDQDSWSRLWMTDRQNYANNDQILSSNGRKYWNFNGFKYHTFGGIKNFLLENPEDSDEDNFKAETPTESFDPADFAKLKFQTFGGIKKSKKIDGKGIPMYKRVTLRSSFSNHKNTKYNTKRINSAQSDSVVQNNYKEAINASNENFDARSARQNNYHDNFEENGTKYPNVNSRRRYISQLYKRQAKTVHSSLYRSSSDDDWQDEDVHMPDNVIMQKFLKDLSKNAKSRSNSDKDSTYFLNTSRRKVFDSLRKTRSQKYRSSDDNESLKLEPPIVPEVVEKTFETLQDLRTKGRKKKHKSTESGKKLGVRSLSDLTICNDVKTKVAKWQNNNVEGKYQLPVRQSDISNEAEKTKEKFSKKIECQRSWEDERMEEILENERKNSKNEINAKLNNQENYENAVIETKKSNSDDNPRKIKRIDLKAYGFENEFFSNKTIKTSTPRVVNKLDLKSFGYDDGIRRTQSNIQLNSIGTRASGDNNLTQSTEALNNFENESYNDFGLKSAKSVPNIAKFYSNANSQEDEEVEGYNHNSYNEFGMIKNGSVKNLANNYNLEKCNIKSSDCSIDESENDTDNSSEKEQSHRSISDVKKKTLGDEQFDKKLLPMPSVRRLAEAFSKQTEHVSAPISKVTKSSNMYKERSSTPEIQIVETPRQMHSLTARSLSKQFREGLRQIPNKVTSPPASHVTMEQPNIPEIQTEVVQAKSDVSNDTNVILPGKLKSNIIFWEQMQKKS